MPGAKWGQPLLQVSPPLERAGFTLPWPLFSEEDRAAVAWKSGQECGWVLADDRVPILREYFQSVCLW